MRYHLLEKVRGLEIGSKASDVARLSPLHHKHINVLGRYSFTLAEPVVKGELRPLNNPDGENLLVALG